MNISNKAIFLDKDGTLIIDVPYNVDPEKIILSADCTTGLKSLQDAGYLLIIITNQAGIARGYFKQDALVAVERKLKELLAYNGIKLNGFYYCPHHPDGVVPQFSIECDCRKPQAGMFKTAADESNIDLDSSWMIGDILNDVEAGNRAGCKSILIDNGNETEWVMNNIRMPALKVKNINQAALYILNYNGK